MRCNNCGWDNPAGLTVCEKCGAPLLTESARVPQQNYAVGRTSRENASSVYSKTAMEVDKASVELNKTIREVSVFGDERVSDSLISNNGRCPKCGYPLRPGVCVCPKCHNVIVSNESDAVKVMNRAYTQSEVSSSLSTVQEHADITPSFHAPTDREFPHKQTNFGGTVMPGMNISPDIWFSLTPLAIQGERETPVKVEFEGKHHELNRENLDSKNHTITSKIQAVMDYNIGNRTWYIQDKSSMQYTFLHCDGDIPVMNGDVILMGDRRFIFRVEDNVVADEPKQFTGTIAVGRQRMNAPRCALIPIVDEGELDAPQEHMFRGDAHQLNRANLDPENHTITSKVQAELTCENGQWFIRDCSQMLTTYILCQDPMDLKNGDRILMGNRIFVFNC